MGNSLSAEKICNYPRRSRVTRLINDIPLDLTSQMKLFADHALIFRPIKYEHDCKSLQTDLNNLEIWSKKMEGDF